LHGRLEPLPASAEPSRSRRRDNPCITRRSGVATYSRCRDLDAAGNLWATRLVALSRPASRTRAPETEPAAVLRFTARPEPRPGGRTHQAGRRPREVQPVTPPALLAALAARGVRLTVVGSGLHVDAPRGELTATDREMLGASKAALVTLLTRVTETTETPE